jgi:uroporphyrinogen-III decarboxylase
MPERMTSKERWLAALHLQPVDRLPFWPKLDGSYARVQQSPYREMDLGALHEFIGSDIHVWIPACVSEIRKTTSVMSTREKDILHRTFQTTHGQMKMVERFDEGSQAWHPIEFPIKGIGDVKLMTEVYEDVGVELDRGALETAIARHEAVGQEGLTATAIGKSPLMQFVELYAGVEGAHYLLADNQAAVETLFDAMHRVNLKRTEILSEHSPTDVLYMIENTSTTLISPDQYSRYCHRHLKDYAQVCRNAGRDLVLHMCGHLKVLLPELEQLPVSAFEAFTSPTLGNTTLLDGRSDCPRKCLIGGTNATLWTRDADAIVEQIQADLADLPHHRGIAITSAGVMPPLAPPETIKTVCEWVSRYPVRI